MTFVPKSKLHAVKAWQRIGHDAHERYVPNLHTISLDKKVLGIWQAGRRRGVLKLSAEQQINPVIVHLLRDVMM